MQQTQWGPTQALLIALNALKKQNDHLVAMNATLLDQNDEFKRYCDSISGMADTLVEMKIELIEEKQQVADIGDSLIMLWGQLAAGGVIAESRQRRFIPVSPAAPVAGTPAKKAIAEKPEIGVSDLFCYE